MARASKPKRAKTDSKPTTERASVGHPGLGWISKTLSADPLQRSQTPSARPVGKSKIKKPATVKPPEHDYGESDPPTPPEEVKALIRQLKQLNIPLRVDLGCGQNPAPTFVGVDRFHMPGVMVVADLDQPLPFEDNTVDLLYASHSLEHVADLTGTMKEIYRICKDRAQVVILAPYQSTSLNLANPYHKNMWNEHTPRFFTAAPESVLDLEEYDFPFSENYGLVQSDHSKVDMDLRCIRMEYFYFPQYRDLPIQEQRRLRQTEINICDQILYHLVVIKKSITHEKLKSLLRDYPFFIPPPVAERRSVETYKKLQYNLKEANDRVESLQNELREQKTQDAQTIEQLSKSVTAFKESQIEWIKNMDALKQAFIEKEQLTDTLQQQVDSLHKDKQTLQEQIHQFQTIYQKTREDLQQSQADNQKTREDLQQSQADNQKTQEDLQQSQADNQKTREDLQQSQAEFEKTKEEILALNDRIKKFEASQSEWNKSLQRSQEECKQLSQQLASEQKQHRAWQEKAEKALSRSNELQHNNEALASRLRAFEESQKEWEQNIVGLRETAQTLQDQRDRLEEKREQTENQLQTFQQEAVSARETIKQLTGRLQAFQDSQIEWGNINQERLQKIHDLEKDQQAYLLINEKIDQSLKIAQEQLQQLQQQAHTLKAEITDRTERERELRTRVEETQHQHQQTQARSQNIEEEMEKTGSQLKKHLAENNSLTQQLQDLERSKTKREQSIETLKKQLAEKESAREEILIRLEEIENESKKNARKQQQSKSEIEQLKKELAHLQQDRDAAQNALQQGQADAREEISRAEANAGEQIQQIQATAEEKIQSIQMQLEALQVQHEQAVASGEEKDKDILRLTQRREWLEGQLEHYRQQSTGRLVKLLQPKIDLQSEVSPSTQPLFAGSQDLHGPLDDYVLQLSGDLRNQDFQRYIVECPKSSWKGISLAFLVDEFGAKGELGIEIASPKGELLRHVPLPLEEVDDRRPIDFEFPPTTPSEGNVFELRVFCRSNSETSVRVYEWQKRRESLLGSQPPLPFCLLYFQETDHDTPG